MNIINQLPTDILPLIGEFIIPALDNQTIRDAVSDYLFGGARRCAIVLKYGDIGDWDVSHVTDMSGLFHREFHENYHPFNRPLDNWDVSNVTTMKRMFQNSRFNQPLDNWDVSNVTTMEHMFLNSKFNQPLNWWGDVPESSASCKSEHHRKFERNFRQKSKIPHRRVR